MPSAGRIGRAAKFSFAERLASPRRAANPTNRYSRFQRTHRRKIQFDDGLLSAHRSSRYWFSTSDQHSPSDRTIERASVLQSISPNEHPSAARRPGRVASFRPFALRPDLAAGLPFRRCRGIEAHHDRPLQESKPSEGILTQTVAQSPSTSRPVAEPTPQIHACSRYTHLHQNPRSAASVVKFGVCKNCKVP
jgi:hypothetical protein